MNHNKGKWCRIGSMVLLTALLTGCYDFSNFENFKVEPVNPSIVAPVVNSTITFKELAETEDANTIVIVKPGDTRFYLSFRDTMEIANASGEFSIPPFAYSKTYQPDAGEIPPVAPPAGESITFSPKTFTQTWQPDADSELKLIKLSQGSMNVTVTNNFGNIISGSITLNFLLTPQNQPYTINIPNINPASSQAISLTNLAGYSFNLFDGTSYNTLTFTATITLTSMGNSINPGDNINIDISANNLDFTEIYGKVNKTINLSDQSFPLDIFRSTYIADQHLAEPSLMFKFANSYGIPLSLNVNQLVASNDQTGSMNVVNETVPPDGSLLIGAPNSLNYVGSPSQEFAMDSLKLDYQNSNIEDVFDFAPNNFTLKSGITLGDASTSHDYFVRKNSNLTLFSNVEVPLVGWVETNGIRDTVEIDLPDIENDLNMEDDDELSLTLKFRFNNGIPLNVYFQAYFIDDYDHELTRLYTNVAEEQLIESAAVNPSTGKVTTPNVKISEISIDRNRYKQMQGATKLVLQVRFKTGGSTHQNIVVESTNSIDIQMSIKAKGTVRFDS
ncbi:MAG TPA: hypothetical protein PLA42_03320 [Tenuifilaceae bacterium]|nr:hypothetical protein [Tenuifilaceae bacterium]HQN83636.1 hypothetical protein [Tenuifilaceae bacterium]